MKRFAAQVNKYFSNVWLQNKNKRTSNFRYNVKPHKQTTHTDNNQVLNILTSNKLTGTSFFIRYLCTCATASFEYSCTRVENKIHNRMFIKSLLNSNIEIDIGNIASAECMRICVWLEIRFTITECTRAFMERAKKLSIVSCEDALSPRMVHHCEFLCT